MMPSPTHFVPIIEPVKVTLNGLTTAMQRMMDCSQCFALVLNPDDGDFRRTRKDLLSEIPLLTEHQQSWIPAFLYKEADRDSIRSVIDEKRLGEVMLIFKNGVDMQNEGITSLIGVDAVRYVVNGNAGSRINTRRLIQQFPGKTHIRLDENFHERTKNADYLQREDEDYTEQHLFYAGDGFQGISDYTCLPKVMADGGMLPYAVAIHLIYQGQDAVVFVHHFVSDTNDDQSNVQGKFFEAASKVRDFFQQRGDSTPAVEEIVQLIHDNRFPGLGYLKKLSIKNNIQLMNQIMESER